MILLLLGAPGSGKGTQAKILKDKLHVPHLSTGDMLRSAVSKSTKLGQQAKQFMEKGQLVPDSLVLDLLKERVQEGDCKGGFILDGFPRNLPQAKLLEGVLESIRAEISHVVAITVNESDLTVRLTGRRTCKACGAGYHIKFQPPKKENICDKCSGELFQRNDDQEKVISERFKVYSEQTEPLLEFYGKKNILKTVNGNTSPENVTAHVLSSIGFVK